MRCIRVAAVSLLACTFLIVAAIAAPPRATAADPPLNVVLIIGDDQGYTDYGFMGHPQIQTPNLDRLSRESLTFRRGYVAASLCCPSLASIITGRYPHQTGITGNDPPGVTAGPRNARGSSPEMVARWNAALDDIPTLPRILAQHGYRSFQTGKWWHGDFSRGGFTHGMTQGTRHGDAGLTIGREGLRPIFDFIADARQAQKPFFVWYAPFLPHAPHTPPDRLLDKYRDQTDSIHVARYWAMCEWLDETVGELLGHLEQQKLAEQTLVIYVCDNGWIQSPTQANAFAPKNKTTPFDFGHRTPILVRWPGKISPASSDTPVSSLDIVPTVLASAGIEVPADLPGVCLTDSERVAARPAIFGEVFVHTAKTLDQPAENLLWRWVVQDRWRLIVPSTQGNDTRLASLQPDRYLTPDLWQTLVAARPLLFDVVADPHEMRELSQSEPERAQALLDRLNAWWTP